jgi:hypothetical protein
MGSMQFCDLLKYGRTEFDHHLLGVIYFLTDFRIQT